MRGGWGLRGNNVCWGGRWGGRCSRRRGPLWRWICLGGGIGYRELLKRWGGRCRGAIRTRYGVGNKMGAMHLLVCVRCRGTWCRHCVRNRGTWCRHGNTCPKTINKGRHVCRNGVGMYIQEAYVHVILCSTTTMHHHLQSPLPSSSCIIMLFLLLFIITIHHHHHAQSASSSSSSTSSSHLAHSKHISQQLHHCRACLLFTQHPPPAHISHICLCIATRHDCMSDN